MSLSSRAVVISECKPNRLTNLLDIMQHFMCWQLVKVVSFLKECECLGTTMVSSKAADFPIKREAIDGHYRPMLEYSSTQCEQIGLQAAIVRCGHFRNALKKDLVTFREIANQAQNLREAIEGELKFRRFALVSAEKGKVQDAVGNDWELCLKKFDSAKDDVRDAVDAYALGLNTACVFHLMRIAERGLRALAKERKVKLPNNRPLEWAEWQSILAALEKNADAVSQWKRGAMKDKALVFYRGTIAELTGFKDEYRNHVMHTRKGFDEFQASSALFKVRSFMNKISALLDENPKRSIDWRKQ